MAKLIAEKSTSRLNLQNEQDLNPVLVDRKFGRPEDFIELHIAVPYYGTELYEIAKKDLRIYEVGIHASICNEWISSQLLSQVWTRWHSSSGSNDVHS